MRLVCILIGGNSGLLPGKWHMQRHSRATCRGTVVEGCCRRPASLTLRLTTVLDERVRREPAVRRGGVCAAGGGGAGVGLSARGVGAVRGGGGVAGVLLERRGDAAGGRTAGGCWCWTTSWFTISAGEGRGASTLQWGTWPASEATAEASAGTARRGWRRSTAASARGCGVLLASAVDRRRTCSSTVSEQIVEKLPEGLHHVGHLG